MLYVCWWQAFVLTIGFVHNESHPNPKSFLLLHKISFQQGPRGVRVAVWLGDGSVKTSTVGGFSRTGHAGPVCFVGPETATKHAEHEKKHSKHPKTIPRRHIKQPLFWLNSLVLLRSVLPGPGEVLPSIGRRYVPSMFWQMFWGCINVVFVQVHVGRKRIVGRWMGFHCIGWQPCLESTVSLFGFLPVCSLQGFGHHLSLLCGGICPRSSFWTCFGPYSRLGCWLHWWSKACVYSWHHLKIWATENMCRIKLHQNIQEISSKLSNIKQPMLKICLEELVF